MAPLPKKTTLLVLALLVSCGEHHYAPDDSRRGNRNNPIETTEE